MSGARHGRGNNRAAAEPDALAALLLSNPQPAAAADQHTRNQQQEHRLQQLSEDELLAAIGGTFGAYQQMDDALDAILGVPAAGSRGLGGRGLATATKRDEPADVDVDSHRQPLRNRKNKRRRTKATSNVPQAGDAPQKEKAADLGASVDTDRTEWHVPQLRQLFRLPTVVPNRLSKCLFEGELYTLKSTNKQVEVVNAFNDDGTLTVEPVGDVSEDCEDASIEVMPSQLKSTKPRLAQQSTLASVYLADFHEGGGGWAVGLVTETPELSASSGSYRIFLGPAPYDRRSIVGVQEWALDKPGGEWHTLDAIHKELKDLAAPHRCNKQRSRGNNVVVSYSAELPTLSVPMAAVEGDLCSYMGRHHVGFVESCEPEAEGRSAAGRNGRRRRRMAMRMVGAVPMQLEWAVHPETWLESSKWPLHSVDGTISVHCDALNGEYRLSLQVQEFKVEGLTAGMRCTASFTTPLFLPHGGSANGRLALAQTLSQEASHRIEGTITAVSSNGVTVRMDNANEKFEIVEDTVMDWKGGKLRLAGWRRTPLDITSRSMLEPTVRIMATPIVPSGTRVVIVGPSNGLHTAVVVEAPRGTHGGSKHTVRLERPEGGYRRELLQCDLNRFNHTTAVLSAQEFDDACRKYCHMVARDRCMVEDAITGMRLSIEKQVVLIGVRGFFGVQRGSYTAVGNARELASVLLAQVNTNRWHGSFDSQPVLVRANPGTGKTWSMLQLQFFLAADTLDPSIATRANNICAKLLARKSHSTETLDEDIVDDSNSSDGSDDGSGEGDEGPDDAVADDNAKPPAAAFGEAALERERADSEYASASFIDADPGTSPASTAPQPILVPFLVLIQRLAPMFRARGSAPKRGDLSLIVEYIRTYEPEYSEMLEMALRMRTLVLLVDGLDEAAGLREVIEDYVVYTLASSGCRLIVTSRPQGVRLEAYPEYATQFVVLDLEPLTPEQQLQCAKQQLSGRAEGELVGHLIAFSNLRRRHDEIFAERFLGVANRIVHISHPDLFYLQDPDSKDGSANARFDPRLIQHVLGDSRMVQRLAEDAQPQSLYLKRICTKVLNPSTLLKLDDLAARLPPSITQDDIADEVEQATHARKQAVLRIWKETASRSETVAKRWTSAANKFEVGAAPSTLWRSIVQKNLDGSIPNAVRFCGAAVELDPTLADGKLEVDNNAEDEKERRKLPTKLVQLAHRLQVKPSVLWKKIVRDTDEIYQVTDVLSPELVSRVARTWMRAANVLGICNCIVAPRPKDPVRLFEKGVVDYGDRFPEHADVPAAGVVFDVLRARLVCREASSIAALLESIETLTDIWVNQGKTLWVRVPTGDLDDNGSPVIRRFAVGLRLVRLKNKFARGNVDPSHFRNAVCNVEMTCREVDNVHAAHVGRTSRIMVEFQLHHADILEHNASAHAHAHYEYFRSQLGNAYNEGLDEMLERVVSFFDVIQGVPVVFSILILVLGSRRANEPIPANRSELYMAAITAALARRVGRDQVDMASEMYRKVAAYLMTTRDRARVFSINDVKAALEGREREFEVWRDMRQSHSGLPLIRTLAVGDDEGAGDEVEFKHLSFQEGLFATSLASGESDIVSQMESSSAAEVLADPSNANVFLIGGEALGKQLLAKDSSTLSAVDGSDLESSPSAWRTACACKLFKALTNIVSLQLEGIEFDGTLPDCIGDMPHLKRLEIKITNMHGVLPRSLGKLQSLKTLQLSDTRFEGPIPTELGQLHDIGSLVFSGTSLTGSIPTELGQLRQLDELVLSGSGLTGHIPTELGQLENLKSLSVASNFLSGTIPSELANISNLHALIAYSNELSGRIPSELSNLPSLNIVFLNNNDLTGPVPSLFSERTKSLTLYGNELTGTLPVPLSFPDMEETALVLPKSLRVPEELEGQAIFM